MDKLVMQVKGPDEGRGKCVVRVSQEIAKIVHDLAYRTRRSDREVADELIAFAAARVELEPDTAYRMKILDGDAS